MTISEVIKTIFGYYRNWEKDNGFIPSDQITPINGIREGEEEDKEETNEETIILEESKKIENTEIKEKDIFSNMYGHDSLKIILKNALANNEPVHILLTGSVGTAKSLFLEAIADNVKHGYFINNNSTGAGIIQYLYDHPELKILLIDEVEKLKKDEIAVLLTII